MYEFDERRVSARTDTSRPTPALFFLLMTRPPPRSTLFPYTTLFRSDRLPRVFRKTEHVKHRRPDAEAVARAEDRSEEHTSELQSLAYLVCRLLLEKKKKYLLKLREFHLYLYS